jgi:hypothetical protein
MVLAMDEVAFVTNTFIVLTHMQQENGFMYHFSLSLYHSTRDPKVISVTRCKCVAHFEIVYVGFNM